MATSSHASLEQITEQVRETYPFHPSFKHLVALFKENEGFRQTRGLMQFTARLLKSVSQREYDDVFLIGTQHLDLNDDQVKDEIERIAPKLMPAVTRDIADNGNAIAEAIDDELDSDAAKQVMTLLLASSLSRAVGGRIGLTDSEIIEYLAAPNRKADEFLEAIQRLREQAWYLHREEQRLFVKETENLSRQIERNAKEVPQPKIDQALINRLTGILQPERRNAYQDVQVLPKLDELNSAARACSLSSSPITRCRRASCRTSSTTSRKRTTFWFLPVRTATSPTLSKTGYASSTLSSRSTSASSRVTLCMKRPEIGWKRQRTASEKRYLRHTTVFTSRVLTSWTTASSWRLSPSTTV